MTNRIENMTAVILAQDNKLFMDVVNSIPEWCNNLDNNSQQAAKSDKVPIDFSEGRISPGGHSGLLWPKAYSI